METENKIAIIGYNCQVAGADDPQAFYEIVSQNKSGLSRSSPEDQSNFLDEAIYQDSNFINVGGGPKDFQCFDARFFGYSPKEAELLDPQIRKALECAYHTVEAAGYAPESLKGDTSCYVASSVNSYFNDNLKGHYQTGNESTKSHLIFLNEPDFLSTRIAYHFNWQGASFSVKSGCSGSMLAIHEACKSLLHFECDNALAGGVNIKTLSQFGYIYEQDGILAADGRCCPFSEDATGTVFANGIGFVLLKRLEDAINDGDTIHAAIIASYANNDGKDKVGYMAPSVSGQLKAMETALAYADIQPQQVSYIESHGTGTYVGDPIEYKGLQKVYNDCPPQSIALRSVKANIGHTDCASGVTALIKVLEDLKHQTISPNHNFTKVNEKCDLSNSPFYFNTSLQPWEPIEGRRIAAISSFGIGGTNVQLIIEEFIQEPSKMNVPQNKALVFAAKSPAALEKRIQKCVEMLQKNPDLNLHDLSATLLLGQNNFEYRFGIVASHVQEAIDKLSVFNYPSEAKQVNLKTPSTLNQEIFENPQAVLKNYLSGAVYTLDRENPIPFRHVPLPKYPFEKECFWVDQNENKNQKIQDISRWFYLPYWQRRQSPLPPLKEYKKTILLFENEATLVKEYKQELEVLGATIITVNAAESFSQSSEINFRLNPRKKEDYEHLFTRLKSQSLMPETMIHCWSLSNEDKDQESCLDKGLYSLLYTIQSLEATSMTFPRLVQIITNHTANVSGNEIVIPINAMMQSMSQVLPKEYDDLACQLIDVDNLNSKQILPALMEELHRKENAELALRGKSRFIKAYQPTRIDDNTIGKISIAKGKNYLVIGGLGNFGIELAEFIGGQHQGQVFLTTRMQFPNRAEWQTWQLQKPNHAITEKINLITNIEKQGIQIEILTADVLDITSLQNVKKHIENQYGPLSGVVHAAGVVDSGMIRHKTVNSLEQVFAPKVIGTNNVCSTFLNHSLDFLILCSSMNSIIGGLGQLDNTAANAYIDAYAEHCLNRGFNNVLAINWGAVNEARARNYSAQVQFAKLSEEHIKNKMEKSEIFEVYRRLFSSQLGPRVVVSTIDFNQVIENWSRVGSLQSLISTKAQQKQKRTLDPYLTEPDSDMEKSIARTWEDLLGIDKVVLEDDFFTLGGNSLIAIQFISELTKNYPIKMHAMAIYEYPTLAAFAKYVERLVKDAEDKQALMV
ncbi:SDR family NAD(P)-dependent oxidoreductase [Legionella israelensis]|uniref:Non-ribosomal peptide synthetase/polyketide synthetase n=1 Tax=Legionella israelensis TaxID=454 RepID=A0A0W0WS85_9GAMM|nr:SDR family NAD(P)-dependent oxidoreductase [Legionella israelensis]KTD35187.1 non-ribosomal peptide synthetase/polyketide synthetase [Legionella israelensis]QBS10403.1 KR domain-containing protein [Legionella israelensis]SCY42379.1 Phosphopantetheine attachment site [Legionella israelensis DSM 19235]STX60017.1 non-ribosomal peptide synthetase/polyketide synthetase [Legionella israelensis]